MPIRRHLKRMRSAQQLRLFKVVANQLQTHGHAVRAKTCGHAHAGQACQAAGQGVNVGQVVGHRIGLVLANLPRHGGRHRPGNDVALGEGFLKVLRNQAADFLGFEVVRVVVAVRQHIGADHDAARGFVAKAL